MTWTAFAIIAMLVGFDFLGGGAGGGNVLPKAICIPLVMLEPPNMTQPLGVTQAQFVTDNEAAFWC